MSWTTPKTWTNEPLIAADMNTHIRDNLEALKEPPAAEGVLDEGANYTTTSTSVGNVDGTDTEGKLRHTIVTAGGDIMVGFSGMCFSDTDSTGLGLMVSVDGITDPLGADTGYTGLYRISSGAASARWPISFTRILTGYAAGSHIIRLQWRATGAGGGTITLYAGAGTTGADVHPQFWVREI